MCITLFCTFLSNYNMKVPNFTFWRRHEHMTTSFLEVNSRTNHQDLMNWTRWNKGSKVWSAQILSLLMCRRSIRHHLNSIKEKECHLKIKKTFAIAYSGRLWFYLSCTVEIFQAQLNSFFTNHSTWIHVWNLVWYLQPVQSINTRTYILPTACNAQCNVPPLLFTIQLSVLGQVLDSTPRRGVGSSSLPLPFIARCSSLPQPLALAWWCPETHTKSFWCPNTH